MRFITLVICFGFIICAQAREYKPSTIEDTQIFVAMPKYAAPLNTITKVPLIKTPKGSHYVLEVFLNGKGPYNFLLDTGASAMFLGNKIIEEVEPELLLSLDSRINNQAYTTDFHRLTRVTFGEVTLYDYDGYFIVEDNTEESMSEALGIRIDGILGFGAFFHYLMTIDLNKSNITLMTGQLEKDMPGVVPFDDDLRVPRLALKFLDESNNEVDATMLVDSGHFSTVQLPPGNDKLPFEIVEQYPILSQGMQGMKSGYYAQINAHYYLGPFRVVRPWVIYGVEHHTNHGMLGTRTLRNFKITFDQKHDLMKVEPSID